MKVAPVSADLLIELALGAAALGGLAYVAWRIKAAADDAGSAVSDAVDQAAEVAKHTATVVVEAVNPADPQNIVNRGATAVAAAVTGKPNDGTWSLGTWLYDATHPDPLRATP
jgi:hypothetical protein